MQKGLWGEMKGSDQGCLFIGDGARGEGEGGHVRVHVYGARHSLQGQVVNLLTGHLNTHTHNTPQDKISITMDFFKAWLSRAKSI